MFRVVSAVTVPLWVSLAGVFALATPCTALDLNGFLPGSGQGNLSLSVTAEGYDHFWVGETRVADPGVGEVDTTSLSVWLQYGFTERLALVANLAGVDADSDGAAGFAEKDPQDGSALLAFRFMQGGSGGVRHSLVGAAGLRTPLTNYEDNAPVDVGDGTTDALLRLVYLAEGERVYFSQQVGYDVRGGDAPDGFPLFTELGVHLGRLTLSATYCWLVADGGTDIGDPGFTFPSNQEEYQRAGLKAYARVTERFGLSLMAFDTLEGRNTGETSGFSAGVNFGF